MLYLLLMTKGTLVNQYISVFQTKIDRFWEYNVVIEEEDKAL